MQDNILPFPAPASGAFPDAAQLQRHVDHLTTPSQPYPTPPGLESFISVLDLLNAGQTPLAIAQALRQHPAHERRIHGWDYPLAQAAALDDLRDTLDWHGALWTACQATGRDFAALDDGADNPLARYGWPESRLPPAFRSPVPLASAPTDQQAQPQPPASTPRTEKATATNSQNAAEVKAQAKVRWLELDKKARERPGHGLRWLKTKINRSERTLRDWIKEWREAEAAD